MISEIANSTKLAKAPQKKVAAGTIRKFYVRWFFVIMGTSFLLVAVLGFAPDYMMMASGGLHAHWFAHVHGAVMTAWLLVFLVQAILAAQGKLNYHRRLGILGFAIGILVFSSMIAADVRARMANLPPEGDDSWEILLIVLSGSLLFGCFFAWGMLARKNAATHKRLLVLATVAILQPAVDRLRFLPFLNVEFFFRFIYLDLLLLLLVIYDLVSMRRLHKITIIGAVSFILAQTMVSFAVGTPAWHKFAFGVFAPFMKMPVEIKLKDADINPLLGFYGTSGWKVQVYREDGKVYMELPQVPRFEMGAISQTEWFMKRASWRVTFVRSPDGKIIKIINKQPNVTWELPRFEQP